MTPAQPAPPKRRGRRRREETIVAKVRLPVSIYDAYCRGAARSRQDVGAVLRDVLSLHARRRLGTLSIVSPELVRAIQAAIRSA